MADNGNEATTSVAPEQKNTSDDRVTTMHVDLEEKNTITVLRHKLYLVQRNASLLLIYYTVFMDFIGLTLLAPGMRFMVSPFDHGAFDDVRLPPECQLALSINTSYTGNLTAAECTAQTSITPGDALGIMMLAFGIGQMISGPILGCMSDKVGPRRVLLISTTGTTAAFVLQGCLWSFWPHVVARFIGGLFAGTKPVCQAFIAASVPRHERAAKMGYMSLSVMAAMMFGPVLGGSLSQVSLRLPLFVAAGMAALTFALQLQFLNNPPPRPKGAGSGGGGKDGGGDDDATKATSQWDTQALIYLLASSTMFVTMAHMVVLPIVLADQYALGPNEIGLLQWGDSLLVFLATQFYTRSVGRFGLWFMAAVGSAFHIAQIAMPFTDSFVAMSIVRYLYRIGPPLMQPVAPGMIALVAPPEDMGKWMATQNFWGALTRAIAPIVLGPLYDLYPSIPFVITGIGSAVPLACALLLKKRTPAGSFWSSKQEKTQTVMVSATGGGANALEEGGAPPMVSKQDSGPAVRDLASAYERLEMRRREEAAGKPTDALDLPGADGPTTADIEELGRWMSEMLMRQGYKRWHVNTDMIRAVSLNAFPRVRPEPHLAKLTDLLGVIEAHFELQKSWSSYALERQEHSDAVGATYG